MTTPHVSRVWFRRFPRLFLSPWPITSNPQAVQPGTADYLWSYAAVTCQATSTHSELKSSELKSSGMGQKHLKTTCRPKAHTLIWGPQQYTEFTRGLAAYMTPSYLLLLLLLCIHREAVKWPAQAAPNAVTDKRNVSTCASQINGRIHALSPITVYIEIPGFTQPQGLYPPSDRTSYRKSVMYWSTRFGRFQLLWNLRGISAPTLPRCLSNFRVARSL